MSFVPHSAYPGADHAFAQDPDGAHYRAEDAADAWARALTFLRSRGKSTEVIA